MLESARGAAFLAAKQSKEAGRDSRTSGLPDGSADGEAGHGDGHGELADETYYAAECGGEADANGAIDVVTHGQLGRQRADEAAEDSACNGTDDRQGER